MRPYSIALAITILFAVAAHPIHAAAPNSLIKGSSSTLYWYAGNGLRYVFPNERTYFTWFPDFSNIQTVSDSELAQIRLDGVVKYRPGRKLVKIESDPKVYAVVEGGGLRWVKSEAIAAALYGNDWSKQVEDIPVGFFSDYIIGEPIAFAWQYDPKIQYRYAQDPTYSIASNYLPPNYAFETVMVADKMQVTKPETVTLRARVGHIRRSTLSGGNTVEDNRYDLRIRDANGDIVQACSNIAEGADCTSVVYVAIPPGTDTKFYAEATNHSGDYIRQTSVTISHPGN